VADGDVLADDCGEIGRAVDHGVVLDVGASSDDDPGLVAAQHDAEPDAGTRADLDVPDEHRGRGDEGVRVHPRPPAVELVFRHWPIILASCTSSTGGQPLANTPSAKKDAKRSAIRAQRNRSIRSSVKTKITKFRRGVTEGAESVEQLAVLAVSALDRAVAKGVLHRNNGARRKARLMKRLQASEQAAPAPAHAPAPTRSSRSSAAAQPAKGTRAKAASKR